MYNDFTEMPVWQMSNQVVKEIYELTSELPRKEDYALAGQIRRAVISISGNLAEGFGRGYIKDKLRFYYHSRGSAFEVRSHLLNGKNVGYFLEEKVQEIDLQLLQIIEQTNKLIKGLKSKI